MIEKLYAIKFCAALVNKMGHDLPIDPKTRNTILAFIADFLVEYVGGSEEFDALQEAVNEKYEEEKSRIAAEEKKKLQ
jgi:hypothetical protein